MVRLLEKNSPSPLACDKVLRAIVTLNLQEKISVCLKALKPTDFPSRYTYRQALIKQQDTLTRQLTQKVRKKLQNIVLKVFGSTTGSIIIIEGTPSQIEEVASLKEVKRVILDNTIQI